MPVPGIPQIVETVSRTQSSQPKTILGFLFGVTTLLVVSALVAVIALAHTVATSVLLGILAAPALVAVGVLIAVIRQARSDPSGLLLGQITGDEYAAIRETTLGDSSSGERRARLSGTGAVVSPRELEAGAIEASTAPDDVAPDPESDKRNAPT